VIRGRGRTRLALLVAGVLAAFGLLAATEIVLRLAGAGAVHELHEFATPAGTMLSRERDWDVRARDAKLSLDRIACLREKPAGTFRVVVVGESTAAGFPFWPQFSFGRALETRLRHDLPGTPIEIVNFGRAADPSEAVMDTALEALERVAPDLLVVSSGHNEYQASYVDDLRDGFAVRVIAALRELRIVRALRLSPELSNRRPEVLPDVQRGEFVAARPFLSPREFARGEERLLAHLRRIAATARDAGCDVVFMTQPSNLSRFTPCLSHHSRPLASDPAVEYERLVGEWYSLMLASADPSRQAAIAQRLDELDPDVAVVRYLDGRRLEAAGDATAARREFARSLELDGYPNRARSGIQRVICEAAASPGSALIDVAAAFAAATRLPAPGDDLFLDHCHPTLESTFLLADVLLPTLARKLESRGVDVAHLDSSRPSLSIQSADEWLAAMRLDRTALADGPIQAGMVNLLLELASPVRTESLRLSRHGFEVALALRTDDARAVYGLCLVELLEHHKEAALELQERLLARQPDGLKEVEQSAQKMPRLLDALRDLGLRLDHGRLVPGAGSADGPK
jgi:hypothetical protein